MPASTILGWILVGLGIIIILIGVVMGVLITLSEILEKLSKIFSLRISASETMKSISELLIEILKARGGVFFVVGLILTGGGIWLLVYTPF
jgi:hypothetical protein